MKKIILIIALLMLCGCGFNKDKYANFEHYDLTNHNYKIYSYMHDPDAAWYDLGNDNYAVAVLLTREEEKNALGFTEGILYEVGKNDYILLDSFNGSQDLYDKKDYTMLYKDKLYIIRNSGLIIEYTLKREKTSKRELTFNYDAILKKYEDGEHSYYVFGYTIDSVDDDYIYFKNAFINNVDHSHISLKCSLEDYKCEEYSK